MRASCFAPGLIHSKDAGYAIGNIVFVHFKFSKSNAPRKMQRGKTLRHAAQMVESSVNMLLLIVHGTKDERKYNAALFVACGRAPGEVCAPDFRSPPMHYRISAPYLNKCILRSSHKHTHTRSLACARVSFFCALDTHKYWARRDSYVLNAITRKRNA